MTDKTTEAVIRKTKKDIEDGVLKPLVDAQFSGDFDEVTRNLEKALGELHYILYVSERDIRPDVNESIFYYLDRDRCKEND